MKSYLVGHLNLIITETVTYTYQCPTALPSTDSETLCGMCSSFLSSYTDFKTVRTPLKIFNPPRFRISTPN